MFVLSEINKSKISHIFFLRFSVNKPYGVRDEFIETQQQSLDRHETFPYVGFNPSKKQHTHSQYEDTILITSYSPIQ